jgi:hypothetical protein
MSGLAKLAALATIIGTVFSIYIYYYSGTTHQTVREAEQNAKDDHSKPPMVEDKEKTYSEILIKEMGPLPLAELSELRVRHKAAKEIPSSSEQSRSLFEVVKICLKNRQFDYASEVAKDIPSSSIQSEAYRAIGVVLAYEGQLENAITAAKKIPSSTTQSLALKEIATTRKFPKDREQNKAGSMNQEASEPQRPFIGGSMGPAR